MVLRNARWLAASAGAIGSLLVVVAGARAVLAQPQVPSSFYGTASADGRPLPDGTEITAWIDGKDCTQPGGNETITQGPASVYVLNVMHESQEPGCGTEGKSIEFRVGGKAANQTATFKAGLQRLDLNAGTGSTLPLPPGSNPTQSRANQQATATEQAKFTPKSGVPPTDAISLTRTPAAGGVATPAAGSGGGSGVSPLAVLLSGAAIVAVLGAAGGLALSRRRPPNP